MARKLESAIVLELAAERGDITAADVKLYFERYDRYESRQAISAVLNRMVVENRLVVTGDKPKRYGLSLPEDE